MKRIGGFLLFIFCALYANAQVDCTEKDRSIFSSYLFYFQTKSLNSVEDLIDETARFLLNTPYVASTLEKEPEHLVINLREMDCTTFVENVLALVRTLKGGDQSFEAFCENLQAIRYRDGKIRDYTDRLHYFSDWIYENHRNGYVRDINKEIGGVPLYLNLSFMSTHPASYKQLIDAPQRIDAMKEKEKEINERNYFYLPQSVVVAQAERIKDGDIIGFVTTMEGLDVTHVGIASHEDGVLTFIHASSVEKKVIVNKISLLKYITTMKSNKGILVVRPQEVY